MKKHRTHLKLILKITIIYFAINFVVALFSTSAAAYMSSLYTIFLFFYACYLLWVLVDFVFDKIGQKIRPSAQAKNDKKYEVQEQKPAEAKSSSTASNTPQKVKKTRTDSTSKVETDRQTKPKESINTKAVDNKSFSKESNVDRPLKHVVQNDSTNIRVSFGKLNQSTKVKPTKKIKTNLSSKPLIHHLRRKLYNFVVVDIETTGLEPDARVIQLSAIRYENDKPIANYNKYVNPGNLPLPAKITAITGITNEQLKNAPTFSSIIESFMTFVGTLPWVGHNINRFDIPRLIRNGLPLHELSTIDTLKLARKKLSLEHYGLENLKHYYNIHNGSHNALEDCKTNATVYQHLRDDELSPIQSDYTELKRELEGLTFAITGAFAGYSRNDVEELIKSHGGIVRSSVSHKTNYLIDGTQVSDSLTDGIHSSKELKAREYGTNILDLDGLKQLISTGK